MLQAPFNAAWSSGAVPMMPILSAAAFGSATACAGFVSFGFRWNRITGSSELLRSMATTCGSSRSSFAKWTFKSVAAISPLATSQNQQACICAVPDFTEMKYRAAGNRTVFHLCEIGHCANARLLVLAGCQWRNGSDAFERPLGERGAGRATGRGHRPEQLGTSSDSVPAKAEADKASARSCRSEGGGGKNRHHRDGPGTPSCVERSLQHRADECVRPAGG